MERDGIVRLKELPEREVFIKFESNFLSRINTILTKTYSIPKLAEVTAVSHRILARCLSGESHMRFDVLNKLLPLCELDLKEAKKHIVYLRGKTGFKIYNPNIPFNFRTKAGVRFIAALLGDGCLAKNHVVSYANSDNDLIIGFLDDFKELFGGVEFNSRQNVAGSNVQVISLPPLCGKIVCLVGLQAGPKVVTNPTIPKFIFNLDNNLISEFLAQIIDDEGSVSIPSRHIRIKFAVEEIHSCSNLIEDIKLLFSKLGIDYTIYQIGRYPSSRGHARKQWQIEVHSFKQLERLYNMLDLRHKPKKRKLKKLILSKKVTHYPKRKCLSIYLTIMEAIERDKGYFTSLDLSCATGRSLGTCQNLLPQLVRRGYVKRIKSSYTGNVPSYARYVVVHENNSGLAHPRPAFPGHVTST